jgi:uncharacterized repeat protein (TIGR01451 family)
MKKFLLILLLATSYLLLATNVSAQYGQPSYNYSIIIDKFVGYPLSNKGGSFPCDWSIEYSDNYLPADLNRRYKPNQIICFQIKVKNTSNVLLTDVRVSDTLPAYIAPLEGPGSFNSSTRLISWSAGDFAPNEERVYFMKVQIYNTVSLPADKGLFCLTNKAEVWGPNTYDDDYAQFCVEKQVSPVPPAVPSAGPEMGVLLLTGESIMLGLGIYLKKRLMFKV